MLYCRYLNFRFAEKNDKKINQLSINHLQVTNCGIASGLLPVFWLSQKEKVKTKK
jgi:hypothetical protein